LVPVQEAGDPSQFRLEVRINGELQQTVDFGGLVRNPQRLLAEVGEFMTLGTGDVLMLGCEAGRPRAKVGDRIEISGGRLGNLTNTLVAEESA
jgi:5-oxopent-3-ene-1,2,5-tricarboxylate decarboxylase/2-hydroxyhepta-2,4-diene-1,7-dioate isomerase